MSHNPTVLAIKLFHGRQRPDEDLDRWGSDGPFLKIDSLHCTYFSTFRIGLRDHDEAWLEPWIHGKQDGILVDGLFHYDGVFYGDWTLLAVPETDIDGEFEEAKAVIPRNRHWSECTHENIEGRKAA